jgi:hypothetical protein
MKEENDVDIDVDTENDTVDTYKKLIGPFPKVQDKLDTFICWAIDAGVDVVKSKFKRKKTKELLSLVVDSEITFDPDLVIPDIYIPALEGNSKTSNDFKTICYSELLKKAGNSSLCKTIHPTFFSILENITEDEINYLKDILDENSLLETILLQLQFQNLETNASHSKGQMSVYRTSVESKLGDNFELYKANLISLGLVVLSENTLIKNNHITNKLSEKMIKNGKFIEPYISEFSIFKNHGSAHISFHSIRATTLADKFIEAISSNSL